MDIKHFPYFDIIWDVPNVPVTLKDFSYPSLPCNLLEKVTPQLLGSRGYQAHPIYYQISKL